MGCRSDVDGAGAGVGVVLTSMVGNDFNLGSSLPRCREQGAAAAIPRSPNEQRLQRMWDCKEIPTGRREAVSGCCADDVKM